MCVPDILHLECLGAYAVLYTYIGAWFCRFVQETGEPKSVQSAPLEAALSLESPPQELDVVQYMSCTCVSFLYCLAYLSLHLQFSGPQQSHNTSIRRLQHPCSKAKRWKRMKRSWNLFCAQSPVVCEIFFT